jgi:hypothetical protein
VRSTFVALNVTFGIAVDWVDTRTLDIHTAVSSMNQGI